MINRPDKRASGYLYILVMSILCISAVTGKMCDDAVEINTNCTMLTPSLACGDYYYEIYNISGALLENESLTPLNSTIYQFNFTQPAGGYLVKLCDGTTREVQVEPSEANKMIIAVVILLPALLAGCLFWFAALTDPETHGLLRYGLKLAGMWSFLGTFYFGTIGLVEFFGSTQLIEAITFLTWVFGIIMLFVTVYYIGYIIWTVYTNFLRKQQERLEY